MRAVILVGLIWLGAAISVRSQLLSAADAYVESPAVSAKFPDPPEVIDSPAFKQAEVKFTTHAELLQFISDLKTSSILQTEELGRSQDGREILLLKFIASPPSSVSPIKPTILIIGQQHGNERAGGEAALVIASELARDPSILEKINVLIVPRANPDGAVRDVRGLANGDDVNRDHLLLHSPEGRALAKAFREYSPDVVLDCHEFTAAERWLRKFNGLHKADSMIQYATVPNLAPSLKATADKVRDAIYAALDANRLTREWYHMTNTNDSELTVTSGGVEPDIGRNIAGLRNAISFLSETRGGDLGTAHFKRRVFTHLVFIRAVFDYVSKNAEAVLLTRLTADVEVIEAGRSGKGPDITVLGLQTPGEGVLSLLHPVDGSVVSQIVPWSSAVDIRSVLTRKRPFGYIIKLSENKAIETLQNLGVKVRRTCGSVQVEKYTVASVQEIKKPDVTGSVGTIKDTIMRLSTEVKAETIDTSADDYYVPVDQALGNIVITALEPESMSSFPANYIYSEKLVAGYTLPVYRVLEQPKVQFDVKEDSSKHCVGTGGGDGGGGQNSAGLVSTGVYGLVICCLAVLNNGVLH